MADTKLYFRNHYAGNDFIAVVTSPDNVNIDTSGLGDEIDEGYLPKDLHDWRLHTSWTRGVNLVEVWTPNGDSPVTYGQMHEDAMPA
jgi:hypothetical protein